MERKPIRFEIRLQPAFADEIDKWRKEQPDLPNRAEAARRLIQKALEAEQEKSGKIRYT